MPKYRRGELLTLRDQELVVQVLGGPNVLISRYASVAVYTVRIVVSVGVVVLPGRVFQSKTGESKVLLHADLDCFDPIGTGPVQDPLRYKGVIEAHCPNCDEPDMIFYSEDYICAWCREHLEDAMC